MKRRAHGPVFVHALTAILVLSLSFPTFSQAQDESSAPDPREQLVSDAYIYGFPLVLMAVTRNVMTNVTVPSDTQAPINELGHERELASPDTRQFIRPAADTLDSFAWLDLAKEPMVLRIPDMRDRFFVVQFMDAYTNVFADPGKRTTGTDEQVYAIVGPNWNGTLPSGVRRLDSPTNTALLIGRVQVGGPKDLSKVHTLQNGMRLVPLSGWISKSEPIVEGRVDPSVDVRTPPAEQVAKMNAATFFRTLAEELRASPPPMADADLVRGFNQFGLVPGRPFDIHQLDPEMADLLERGLKRGRERLGLAVEKLGATENGWHALRANIGAYGTDYETRAAVAASALGANLPQDLFFMTVAKDEGGLPLEGRRSYMLHFRKGELPPTNAGWSVTLYDEQGYLVGNALDRTSLGSRDDLPTNPDGSVDLVIQHDPPFSGDYRNWLPAPLGEFSLMLRIYWPKEAALSGAWRPPPLVRTH